MGAEFSLQSPLKTARKRRRRRNAAARLLLAGLAHVADVREEVVVLRLGHGLPELGRVLKHADEDLQAVQVRVLRGDDLKNGLMKRNRGNTGVGGGGRMSGSGGQIVEFFSFVCYNYYNYV